MKFDAFDILIYKAKPNDVSKKAIWVCVHDCYLYTGDTLFQLLKQMFNNWDSDQHFVG